MQTVFSLLAGIILGVVFSLLKLPLPAPNHINGIIGILGVFLGYMLISKWIKG